MSDYLFSRRDIAGDLIQAADNNRKAREELLIEMRSARDKGFSIAEIAALTGKSYKTAKRMLDKIEPCPLGSPAVI